MAVVRSLPHHGLLDRSMHFASDLSQTWWILVLFLPLACRRRSLSISIAILLIITCSVLISDAISARILKTVIMRPRPNMNSICLIQRCWGFVSSHAANVFCGCTLLSFFLPRWKFSFLAAALIVSFSRLYSEDHFPLDVVGGMALGASVALTVVLVIRTYYHLKRTVA